MMTQRTVYRVTWFESQKNWDNGYWNESNLNTKQEALKLKDEKEATTKRGVRVEKVIQYKETEPPYEWEDTEAYPELIYDCGDEYENGRLVKKYNKE